MKTILVVEDELAVAEMVCAVLEDEGYNVVVARNGRDGLACLAERRPDLVLTDVMMPVMDGREMLRRMRAHSDYRSIPVILLSAIPERVAEEDLSYAALLGKPFKLDTLLDTITRLLDPPGIPRSDFSSDSPSSAAGFAC